MKGKKTHQKEIWHLVLNDLDIMETSNMASETYVFFEIGLGMLDRNLTLAQSRHKPKSTVPKDIEQQRAAIVYSDLVPRRMA